MHLLVLYLIMKKNPLKFNATKRTLRCRFRSSDRKKKMWGINVLVNQKTTDNLVILSLVACIIAF